MMMIDGLLCVPGIGQSSPGVPQGESDGLPDVPASVAMACYRIALRFPRGLDLAGFPGFVLHGMLGATLRTLSPQAYAILFGDADIVHPWMLSGFDKQPAAGGVATFDLRLFNEADRLLPDVLGALILAGCAGLGPARSPFDLVAIEARQPGSEQLLALDVSGRNRPPGATLDRWCARSVPASPVRVTFVSPVALKDGNAPVRSAPALSLLVARTLARLSLLAKSRVLDAAQRQRLLAAAGDVAIVDSSLCWHSEARYSGRQRRTMPFGGLVGELIYDAGAARLAPWLEAAAWIGVGGKTTFGFGQLRWSATAPGC